MTQIIDHCCGDRAVLSAELRKECEACCRLREIAQHGGSLVIADHAAWFANGKVEHCWRLLQADGVDRGARGRSLLQYVAVRVPVTGDVAPSSQQKDAFGFMQP